MKLTVTVESEDEHAKSMPCDLAVHILNHIVRKISQGVKSGPLRDVNGNNVGRWELTK